MLIILGGIGFFVIKDIKTNKLKWKSLSMHSKVVIWVTIILIIFGAVMIKLTNNILGWVHYLTVFRHELQDFLLLI